MPWDTLLRFLMNTAFRYFNNLASWNHKRIKKNEEKKGSIFTCQNKKRNFTSRRFLGIATPKILHRMGLVFKNVLIFHAFREAYLCLLKRFFLSETLVDQSISFHIKSSWKNIGNAVWAHFLNANTVQKVPKQVCMRHLLI